MCKDKDNNVFSILPEKMVVDSICIGPRAGMRLINARRVCLIGIDAGADLTEAEDITIIGDGIRSLDQSQKDVMFINDKVAIGNTLMGVKIGTKNMIEAYLKDIGFLK